MRALLIITFALAVLTTRAWGQWTDHMSYNNPTMVAAVGNIAVCGNTSTLFYYDPSESYLGKLNKINYLSSANPTAIAADGDRLIVGYNNGNIDIVDMQEMATVNIPELSVSSTLSQKTINCIVRNGNRYYMGFSSGVLEVDRSKNEIKSTWKNIGGKMTDVTAVCVANGRIYAGSADGVYTADISSNTLEDPGQWELMDYPTGNIKAIQAIDDVVLVAAGDASSDTACIFKVSGTVADTLALLKVNVFRNLQQKGERFILVSSNAITLYNKEFETLQTITSAVLNNTNLLSSPRDAQILDDERLAFADYNNGLVITSLSGQRVTSHLPNGPTSNSFSELYAVGGTLYAPRAGRTSSFTPQNTKTAINILETKSWSTLEIALQKSKDALFFAVDPDDESTVYVTTWGTGVTVLKDKQYSYRYDTTNSPLIELYGTTYWILTDAIGFDSDKNLIVLSPINDNGINVRTPDGTWYSYSYGNFVNWHSTMGMLVTSNNNIWLKGTRFGNALFIFNINGTPEDPSDDMYVGTIYNSSDKQFRGTMSLTDTSSGDVLGSRITDAAEDRDGRIWVGTTQGLLVCDNDADIFTTNEVVFSRVKVPRNDGTELADYLLEETNITAIAVDGANRKWIGTNGDGVYLVSSDGYEMLEHFTTSNSPLGSDNIVDICVRPTDGVVFISSEYGLLSYQSDASEPVEEMSNKTAKVYPNPASLSSSYEVVNITGLEYDSLVYITDVAGNRVYYAKSNGGMIRWDLRRNGGAKVAPGVYIVWAINSEGTRTAVGKILVKE